MVEIAIPSVLSNSSCKLVWWRLRNFIVRLVNLNSFLHLKTTLDKSALNWLTRYKEILLEGLMGYKNLLNLPHNEFPQPSPRNALFKGTLAYSWVTKLTWTVDSFQNFQNTVFLGISNFFHMVTRYGLSIFFF